MHAQELSTALLEQPTYAERVRALRARRPAFDGALSEAFLERAQDAMRRDPVQARQCARLALYVARHLDDPRRKVQALRALTQAAMLVGRHPEALRAVDDALALLRPHGSRLERAELRSLRVQVLTQLEHYVEARETGERVLAVFEQLGQERGVIRIRMALADLAIQLDRPREALRHYQRVEWLLPETCAPRLLGAIAANRGNALQACNRFRAAARWFHKARDIFAAEGCEHTTAQMDGNLAYAAVLRGDYDAALRLYADVEERFIALGADMHRAHIDLDRAELHLLLNLPDDARGFAERAGERFARLGLDRDRAQAEYFAGRAAAMSGELTDADACYATARKLFGELGLTAREVGCIVQQGYVQHRLGRRAQARRLAEEAAERVDAHTNPLTHAAVILLGANLDLAAGREAEAVRGARQVIERCRRVHAPWVAIEARRIEGRARSVLGQRRRAVRAYEEAVDLLERHRGGVPPDEYMAAFLSARTELYEELVELLVDQGLAERAFEYAERAKSRALLDLLAHRVPETPAPGMLGSRIRIVREALNAVYWQLFRGAGAEGEDVDATGAAHERAATLEAELQRLQREAGLASGAAGAAALAPAPSAAEVRAALGEDTVLLDYLVTRGGLVTFVVDRRGVHALRQALEPDEIEERVQRLRFHLAKHERPELVAQDLVLLATRDNLGQLRARLLDPVRDRLGAARLVISPHGALHGVPFHALPWQDGWLCDRFEVLYAPSAAVYAHCATPRPRARGPAAVFGVPDPRIPHVESETRRVAELLGTERVHVGAAATLEALRAAARDARVLHIATHGMFRPATPGLSAIRLDDGWVTPYDLRDMRFEGELVVLSTCESGVAGVSAGNEILGLARGFLHAGAPALLSSQWRVHDEATAAFMDVFYARLRAGDHAGAAHRAAMAAVRRRHPHPYYWAPFFLTGAPIHPSTEESER